jgi:tetratricopeptide (TPR) repeat protein
MAGETPPKPKLTDDPRFSQAVENYEAAVKALQERKFERAKALLKKVIEGPSTELADRAVVHLSICNQQLARSSTAFKTPEEHYDFAVSLMNQGKYDDSRAHLEKILKQHPKADYAIYGLAVLDCLTGRVEDALRHLDEAIRLNAALRYQARNDSDFQNLADDPRFTELLYPEPGTDFSPPLPRER